MTKNDTKSVTLACQFCGTANKVDVTRHAQGPKCAECQRPFKLDRPIKVDEDHFDRTVLGSEVPVLVDFYADWCGPCVMMAPILDQIAAEVAGEALVVKVNTDQAPRLSQQYGIRSIPFFAGFEKGRLARSAVGAQTPAALRDLIGVKRPTSNV